MISTSGMGFRGMIGSDEDLSALLNSADCNDLKLVIRYCAVTDRSLVYQLKDMLSKLRGCNEGELKKYLIKFVQTVASQRSVVASFPYLAHVLSQMPIQKKGSTLLQRLAICRFADAINDGVVAGIRQDVLAELTRLRERYLADPTTNSGYSEIAKICCALILKT